VADKPVNIVESIPDEDFAHDHTIATKFEVLGFNNEVLLENIETVIDGSVELDAGAASRGRCSLSIIDDGSYDYVPVNAASLLAPFGNEIRVSRGIEYVDRIDLMRLGVFVIESASTADTPQGTLISLAGPDRSGDIVDALFEAPDQIDSGTEIDTAILNYVREVMPLVETNFQDTAVTTPRIDIMEGDDRWALVSSLAMVIGGQLYFDRSGVLRLEPIVFPGGDADVEMVEGEGGLMLGANRDWDRGPVYNKVIVTGEAAGTEAPVRAVAYDSNPESPTYYYGNFGRKPLFWANTHVRTVGEAENAAAGVLAEVIGAPDTISFSSLVNLNFNPNTLVKITRERLGVDELHVLDTISLPLTAEGEMSGRTRAVALSVT